MCSFPNFSQNEVQIAHCTPLIRTLYSSQLFLLHELQYCQKITWHCVCGRFASILQVFCVHPAGGLHPPCGRFASTLRASCVYVAAVLRPQRPRLLCVRLAPGACVQPKLRLLGRTRTGHHKISIQHIGQFTNVKCD